MLEGTETCGQSAAMRKCVAPLGVTSIVVTYDMSESLKVVDYAYFVHNGVVVAEGVAAEMFDSDNPFVHQFVHAKPDGPVAFQYPSRSYPQDLGIDGPR